MNEAWQNRYAWLSKCERYRYTLYRYKDRSLFDPAVSTVAFIMLNPSKADHRIDDPTVLRCVGYADRWGFQEMRIANLYAWRSTDPSELLTAEDPVGLHNAQAIDNVARAARLVVCAWGNLETPAQKARAREVLSQLRELGCEPECLGTTKAGAPRHPVRLGYDVQRVAL